MRHQQVHRCREQQQHDAEHPRKDLPAGSRFRSAGHIKGTHGSQEIHGPTLIPRRHSRISRKATCRNAAGPRNRPNGQDFPGTGLPPDFSVPATGY
ncbi:hypothetical protein SSP24_80300 [Streptomyces spinoverrucosus]|uniref:Uncharacterized protein n=1 Tax=Streptomyces spinoverrucosus TaxID=284043 RepID=A0A4Y3VW55_9ACTN|nr:hypothetical protein SSP24_80300 [Streptomyces spinoverrucosus]GHB54843.1 hypothetical protein GCM10010397_26480 [Streptomyces spinoverrucosus]